MWNIFYYCVSIHSTYTPVPLDVDSQCTIETWIFLFVIFMDACISTIYSFSLPMPPSRIDAFACMVYGSACTTIHERRFLSGFYFFTGARINTWRGCHQFKCIISECKMHKKGGYCFANSRYIVVPRLETKNQ